MKLFKLKIIFSLLISTNLSGMDLVNRDKPSYNIFDYKWELITDSVMGGLSLGDLKAINYEEGMFYKLTGSVSTKNNGGFIQFRSKVELEDNDYRGIEIEYRNNGAGKHYYVHITTIFTVLPWQYYEAILPSNRKWTSLKIPLSNFQKSHFYQPKQFSPKNIKTIGFAAIGGDFDAELDIKRIILYK